MAINTELLIAAPILQDYFVDKTSGLPLAGGIVTLYEDASNPTILKNWYYQTGTYGSYTYSPLNNPLTLSSVGTITDPSGNDTIPFFYPYSEDDNETKQPYYITVVNSSLTSQFTRSNFPFNVPTENISNPSESNGNLIINNVFWRPTGAYNPTTKVNTITYLANGLGGFSTTIPVAPSQHDGLSNMSDIVFSKDTNDAAETINVTPFGLGNTPLVGDITPEWYINHNCTAAGSETQKFYQFPIALHVKSLESQTGTVTIQAQNVLSASNGKITVSIYQYLGTGVTSPNPIPIGTGTYNLNNNWTKIEIPFTFPSTVGLTLGAGGDDGLFLQIGMPVAVTCNLNFCLPSVYLLPVSQVPTNNFVSYDYINSIASSPRTGDIRTSLNGFQPYGWLAMNDGVISNGGTFTLPTGVPSARQNIDTWPLFDLIWQRAKPYTHSTTNDIAQMYTSAGAAVAYGASAYADWTANRQLSLTAVLGRTILASPPIDSFAFTSDGSGTITLTPVTPYFDTFNGMPVVFSNLTGCAGIANNIVYYAVFTSSSTFTVASTYAHAIVGNGDISTGGIAAGSGNTSFSIDGTIIGENFHTMNTNELVSHGHNVTSPSYHDASTAGNQYMNCDNAGSETDLTTSSVSTTGSTTPFNIMQPGVYYNFFIKL